MNKLTHIPRLLGILMAGSLLACNTHAAITNDLVVHLTFDNTYNDTSGNGNNASPVNAPTFEAGQIGQGVHITVKQDGSVTNKVTLGYPASLKFGSDATADTTDFSFSLWVKILAHTADQPYLANKDWDSGGNPGFVLANEDDGMKWNYRDDLSARKDSPHVAPQLEDGKWHNVAVTFERKANGSIYVDGTLVNQTSIAPDSGNAVGSVDTDSLGFAFNIGDDGRGDYATRDTAGIEMVMDDLGIWRRALTPVDVATIYAGGLNGQDLAHVTAKVPPQVQSLVPAPGATRVPANATISATVLDADTAVATNTVQLTIDGTAVTPSVTKSNTLTTVVFSPTNLFAALSTHVVKLSFSDNGTPANQVSTNWSFTALNYATLPPAASLPASAVDTTQPGFLYRVHQIDSGAPGVLAANVAHAEAQLAGLLIDPASGSAYPNIATAGTQPDGSSIITNLINFSFDLSAEQGAFNTANGYPDAASPGITAANSDNMAGEIIGYLDLKAGFYLFAVNGTDGFRLTTAANPYDVLGSTLGLFDYRAITTETRFGVAVQQAGIYPVRLLWYRMTVGAQNKGDASLEFYTVNPDGTKVLVNDSSKATAVKAYWKQTAGYGTFVKYAGPSAFASPFLDSSDVGFTNVVVKISDGTTNKVDAATVKLTVDGTVVTNATVNAANGITTASYIPAGLQLPRTVHAAQLSYKDQGGASYSSSWNFHLLRNYVLPAPLYTEDFESTPAGPNPSVPAGWVQENHTDTDVAGLDQANLHSDFYLGWVVVDKSFTISKDTGVSAFAPQVLNGVAFAEDTNPLLVNHYVRAESDVRNGNQIQFLTTKSYDLTGKTGVVVAFDSAYEQNQNSAVALEYTTDGTNYNPILYWLQGDFDGQDVSDVIRDGLGNVDVSASLSTTVGAHYTDPASGKVIGGSYGAFIKAPITPALAPYIEGRYNDDSTESKRIEVYRVPLADNQKSVQFRFMQVGSGSWYWAIDNWGIYSVPSIAVTPPSQPGPLSAAFQSGKVVISWTGGGTLQTTQALPGTWTDVPSSTSPYSVSPTGGAAFYRLRQ